MTRPTRWLAGLLCTALLIAATLPCPGIAGAGLQRRSALADSPAHVHPAGARAGHPGHAAGGHAQQAASVEPAVAPCHEPPFILSAPCPCGCDRAGATVAGRTGRLGPALPSHAVPARAVRSVLPGSGESLRVPGEPCLAPDPIPI